MSSSAENSARSLLYGILAFQLGIIDRTALVTAFNTWVKSKSQPLSAILTELNLLPEHVRELLDALVEEGLRLHGGSPEKCLAALSTIGSIREELEEIGDADLHATLGHLPAETTQPSHRVQQSTVTASPQTDARFRVVKVHAKGGLGQVSVAIDQELAREVALKELQNKFADDEHNRARFVLEAEIAGGLEHPGIVPVYGAGCYADGRPFYAMRFVRGDSLQDAVSAFHQRRLSGQLGADYDLELRKLLRRFIDVCDAIEYAHSRGVLHRDLKPGNIMLGRYGETLVVDWGLAKPLGRRELGAESKPVEETTLLPVAADGSAPTQMGTAVGTPHYMSPEQAAGRLSDLGPASDVYSLGATLYCLLTGQSPFAGKDVGEILAAVQFGIVKTPRQLNSEVAKPLEAICLKAMAREPDQRYGSPRAIAQDIELWMADQPVSAHTEPWHVRSGRWLRRHRGVAGAGLFSLAVVLISALAITGLLADSNRKLAEKEATAVEARDAAIVARNEATDLAEKNRRLADEAQLQVARAYRRQADELLDKGDTLSGLLWLLKSYEAIPESDDRNRDLAARNLAAWCRNQLVLKKVWAGSHVTEPEPIPDTSRLIVVHEPLSDEQSDPAQEDLFLPYLVNSETLESVTDGKQPFGPGYPTSTSKLRFPCEAEHDLFCSVAIVAENPIDSSSIEPLSPDLGITDEDRERLQAHEEIHEIQRYSISQGTPRGKPLEIRIRRFRVEPESEDESVEFDEYGKPIFPFGDEVLDTNILAGFIAISNCTTNETEVWSMDTGQRVDIKIPAGQAILDNTGMLALLSDDGKIKFYDLNKAGEVGPSIIHEKPVEEFLYDQTYGFIITVTKDGHLHAWDAGPGKERTHAVSEDVFLEPLADISAHGDRIITTTADGYVQLWAIQMREGRISLLRSTDDLTENDDSSQPISKFIDTRGRQVMIEADESLVIWYQVDIDNERLRRNPPTITLTRDEDKREWNILSATDGDFCATYCNNELVLYGFQSDHPTKKVFEHPGRVSDITLCAESERMFTVDDPDVIRVWSFDGDLLGQVCNPLPERGRSILSSSPNGNKLAVLELELELYSLSDMSVVEQIVQLWEMRPPTSMAKAISVENVSLAVAPDERSILISPDSIGVTPDGSKVLRMVPPKHNRGRDPEKQSTPGYFEFLDWPLGDGAGTKVGSFEEHDQLGGVNMSPDGQRITILRLFTEDPKHEEVLNLQAWNTAENKPYGKGVGVRLPHLENWEDEEGHPPWRYLAAVDPLVKKGVVVAMWGEDSGPFVQQAEPIEFSIWNLLTGERIGKPLSHDNYLTCVQFSPDGKIIATASEDGDVKLWDSETGELLGHPFMHLDGVIDIYFSPDGSRLLTITKGLTWQTWDIHSCKPIVTPVALPYQEKAGYLSYDKLVKPRVSEDGVTLLIVGSDSTLRQWDVPSGLPVGPLHQFKGEVTDLEFNSSFLAVENRDGQWQFLPFSNISSHDTERYQLWIATITGAKLDESGLITMLSAEDIAEAHLRLEELGGPPARDHQLPKLLELP